MRAALLALLLLLPPAAGEVSLEAAPSETTAPARILLSLDGSPENATWRILEGDDVLAAGEGLPAQVEVLFEDPGTYRLMLMAGNASAETTVTLYAPAAVSGDVLPLLFAGALMLGLAAWLLRDRQNPINVAFAALFIARGVADITLALWSNQGSWHLRRGGALDAATGGAVVHLHALTSIAVMGAAFWFLFTYLAQNNARLARRGPRVASVVTILTAALMGLYLLVPTVWWDPRTGLPGGWLFLITGLYYPFYAVFALLLFRESVKDMPDDRRAGAFWSGLGFLFLPVFSGAGELLFVDVFDYFGRLESVGGVARSELGLGFEIGHWAAVLALVPVVASAVILARDPRSRRRLPLFAAAVLLPLLSLVFAVSVLLQGSPAAAAEALSIFNIFQGIWAIPYPVLVAYGLMRYQSEEQGGKMARQVRRFGLASFFFTAFFAVSEGLEALASERFGTPIGLGTAAVLTLALNPLQDRLQKRTAAGETRQEVLFYQEQVRKTLEDGHIGPIERKFLTNLQATMGISADTARRIETEIQAQG